MIYAKTPLGQAAMQTRSAQMNPRQRAAFIMFDGKRDSSEVLRATSGVGVTENDVDHLVAMQFLESIGAGGAGPSANAPQTAGPAQSGGSPASPLRASDDGRPSALSQANYSTAYPIATRLTSGLGLRGFRLNLAVEAAGDLEKLKELAPRIKEAVGPEKFKELEDALYSY